MTGSNTVNTLIVLPTYPLTKGKTSETSVSNAWCQVNLSAVGEIEESVPCKKLERLWNLKLVLSSKSRKDDSTRWYSSNCFQNKLWMKYMSEPAI